jgi:hypothetical protein
VQIAGHAPLARATVRRPEYADEDAVPAALLGNRMKRLVDVTNQMHEELERDRAIGTVERPIRETLLMEQDAIDDAVAPAIGP